MNLNRPSHRSRGFALVPVLFVLVLAGAMMAVVSSHLAHLVQAQRMQSLDLELRQMLNSGAAYAELHRGEGHNLEEPVVLDAGDMLKPGRVGRLMLRWMPASDAAHWVCRLEARIEYGSQWPRNAEIEIVQPRD